MNLDAYFSKVGDGFAFLIAFMSLLGFLGLIFGILILCFGGRLYRTTGIKLILVSLVLVGLTGMYTGVKYFRI